MGFLNEKADAVSDTHTLDVPNEKIEVIDLVNEKQKQSPSSELTFSSSSSVTSTTIAVEGYVSDLEWTDEEEKKVLFLIDTRLMPFVLLMTFVLNMDRTNICM
jgi:hypothetical protein